MLLFHRNKQSKYDSCSCTGSIKWKGPLVNSSTITLLFVFPFQCLKSYKALCEMDLSLLLSYTIGEVNDCNLMHYF